MRKEKVKKRRVRRAILESSYFSHFSVLICFLQRKKPAGQITAEAAADFQMDGTTLVKYIGDETNVIIPSSVISIGDGVFGNCFGLKSIILPRSIKVDGDKFPSGVDIR
jgi:hypothetical protein